MTNVNLDVLFARILNAAAYPALYLVIASCYACLIMGVVGMYTGVDALYQASPTFGVMAILGVAGFLILFAVLCAFMGVFGPDFVYWIKYKAEEPLRKVPTTTKPTTF